ncbi:MAG TPA: SUMF1/EgtB/PvdO family nonheme iron enzyme [Vicinamibacterales bacterium]
MPLDRHSILDRFRRSRGRTRALFDLVDDAAYYERPIALRNPIVFYEGHLPAFAVNTLIKKGLGRPGVDEHLETIFARGIDPDTEAAAVARGDPFWPPRAEVQAYARAADSIIADAVSHADLEQDGHPLLHEAQALWTILEHEEMHQETLAYMWHQLPYAAKRKPAHYVTAPPRLRNPGSGIRDPRSEIVVIPGGAVTLGTRDGFAWDNERPAHTVQVAEFDIDVHDVTNAAFLEFVTAGGYRDRRWWRDEDWRWVDADSVAHPPFWENDGEWYWRGMFERVPLPPDWPVYVSWAEANAYARWRSRRLPSEAEYHRAAFGTPDGRERRYPWGDALAGRPPANFDFLRWDPEPVGAHPGAASAFGVHDLLGNGWEWTSTVFAPFDGFAPLPSYPEYSADFFDGDHYVMKGASPVTARALARPGFRNWFRPRYPFVYATFRTAGSPPRTLARWGATAGPA